MPETFNVIGHIVVNFEKINFVMQNTFLRTFDLYQDEDILNNIGKYSFQKLHKVFFLMVKDFKTELNMPDKRILELETGLKELRDERNKFVHSAVVDGKSFVEGLKEKSVNLIYDLGKSIKVTTEGESVIITKSNMKKMEHYTIDELIALDNKVVSFIGKIEEVQRIFEEKKIKADFKKYFKYTLKA